jgi:hypothetical protein
LRQQRVGEHRDVAGKEDYCNKIHGSSPSILFIAARAVRFHPWKNRSLQFWIGPIDSNTDRGRQ